MTTTLRSIPLKLACDVGFSDRVVTFLYQVGIKKIHHVRVLMDATGYTRGGAVKMLDLDRPPKSVEKFESLIEVFIGLYREHTNVEISTDDMERYLLKGVPLPEESTAIEQQVPDPDRQTLLAELFIRDRALTSRVVYRIACIQQEIEHDNPLSDDQIDEIHIRVIHYCLNNEDASDEDIDSLACSLIDIARKGMLLI